MQFKRFIFFFNLFLCLSVYAFAQLDTNARQMSLISAQFSLDMPQADLAKRFGLFDKAGMSYHYKLENNWIFGARFHFIFGNRIKEPGLMQNLYTSSGGIINNGGLVNGVNVYLRGYNTGVDVGKIILASKKNKNAGLLWMGSTGFMQHKLNIHNIDNQYDQLLGEYRKGYDRLTNGWYLDNMIGYMYFSRRKNINLYAGLNFNIARTQGRRDWWLDVQQRGNDDRWDMSTGAIISWFIPIYPKKVEEVYY
jgi:hypothetical protein